MPSRRVLALPALLALLSLVPGPARAQGRVSGFLLGPHTPADLVMLSFFSPSLFSCTDVATRVLGDGRSVPFTVPEGRVLVLQHATFQAQSTGGTDNLFMILKGPVETSMLLITPIQSTPGLQGGSLPLTGVVVRPGAALCFGRNQAAYVWAQVHGFLADDPLPQ